VPRLPQATVKAADKAATVVVAGAVAAVVKVVRIAKALRTARAFRVRVRVRRVHRTVRIHVLSRRPSRHRPQSTTVTRTAALARESVVGESVVCAPKVAT
jgi:hypothetical protein